MNKTMKQRIVAAASLIGIFGSALQAYELRSPWVSERGPLSYIFETEKEDRYSLNLWTAMHARSANKAFKAHGTATEPLTSLMFGKADFPLQEVLPNSFADLKGEFYNSTIRTAVLHPRAQYNEKGITVGGRFEYPVYEDKGRIGVRASVPFRCIEIEREDWSGVTDNADTDQVVKYGYVLVDAANARSFAIRMDAIESARQSIDLNSLLNYATNVKVGAAAIIDGTNVPKEKNIVFVYNKNDGPPAFSPTQIVAIEGESKFEKFVIGQSLQNFDEGVFYYFDNTKDYSAFADSVDKTVTQQLKDQELKRHLWMVKVKKNPGNVSDDTKLDTALSIVADEKTAGNEYLWLYNRGVDFKTERRTGLGDIDLDLFYEHRFTDEVLMEVMLGIRLPTGGSSHTAGNPYRPRLGNGSHAEVKLGAMVAYQPLAWMNMKLDMYYSFVIEGMEHRPAAFEGAQVRHLGPEADAKVDWGYFVGRLDFNFFHPETKSLSSLIGYEVFLKQQDHVRFRKTKMNSWLGRTWNKTAGAFVDNEGTLSNAVAEKDTDAIGHKVRAETSYRVNKYLELFLGGCFTFAEIGRASCRERV